MASNSTPGAYPVVDNQGQQKTCTHLSVVKAICHCLMEHDPKVDVSQDGVETAIVNAFPDLNAREPEEFNELEFRIKDNKTDPDYWIVKNRVKGIRKGEFIDDREDRDKKIGHLVVVDSKFIGGSNGEYHSLFVEDFDEETNTVSCINSWGSNNPNPEIKMKDVQKFYRVRCTATKVENANSDGTKPGSSSRQDKETKPVLAQPQQMMQNVERGTQNSFSGAISTLTFHN